MPSRYEERARQDIEARKNPKVGWFGRFAAAVNRPLDFGGELLLKTPYVGQVIERSVSGLVGIINEVVQASVRPESIFEEYRKNGHHNAHDHVGLLSLDLEQIDRTMGFLAAKYNSIALTEGMLFGTMEFLGIPPDITALVTLNLRAIGEYATYCGFDVSSQQERLFAMHVLGLATSPSDASKNAAMAQLAKIAQEVAKKRTWKDLEKHAFVQIIQKIARALGVRLTKAKLAQIVPVAGAAVGGGFNAHFTSKVCEASYFWYRERFLVAKYGDSF